MDPLDVLPTDIVVKILTICHIRDAVKTSALSRRWRNVWKSMIDFSFSPSTTTNPKRRSIYGHPTKMPISFQQIVQDTLLASSSPIRRLHISHTIYGELFHVCDWKQWADVAVRRQVKELVFRDGYPYHSIPSCLFTCKSLTRLELTHCRLHVDPETFGCTALRSLTLVEVDLGGDHTLDTIFRSCKGLRSVSLSNCHGFSSLFIRHLGLVKLQVCGHHYPKLVSVDAPRLEVLVLNIPPNIAKIEINTPSVKICTILLPMGRSEMQLPQQLRHLVKGILSSPHCSTLMLPSSTLMHMSSDIRFNNFGIEFSTVNILDVEVRITDERQIAILIALLECCPHLQQLNVKINLNRNECDDLVKQEVIELLDKTMNSRRSCFYLNRIELNEFGWGIHDLDFLRFLLSKAHIESDFPLRHGVDEQEHAVPASNHFGRLFVVIRRRTTRGYYNEKLLGREFLD